MDFPAVPPNSRSNPPRRAAELADLCRLAAAGGPAGEQAWQQLMDTYGARLRGFARTRVGADWAGKIDPDDLFQQAMASASKSIATFKPQGPDAFFHWVAAIIQQRFIDEVRRLTSAKRDINRESGKSPGTSGSTHLSLFSRLAGDQPTPSTIVRRDEAIAALNDCIARLPPDAQRLVERLYLSEEPIAQIAADLGKTEDAVRRAAGRAIDKVRECMGDLNRFISQAGDKPDAPEGPRKPT